MLGIILGAFENGKELRYRGEIQTETPQKNPVTDIINNNRINNENLQGNKRVTNCLNVAILSRNMKATGRAGKGRFFFVS